LTQDDQQACGQSSLEDRFDFGRVRRHGSEKGEIGPDPFRAACSMGVEGLVSKCAGRRYRGGRSKDWIKIKNREHPAKAGTVAVFVYAADGWGRGPRETSPV
jgi:ATP-dependent DNA ligase